MGLRDNGVELCRTRTRMLRVNTRVDPPLCRLIHIAGPTACRPQPTTRSGQGGRARRRHLIYPAAIRAGPTTAGRHDFFLNNVKIPASRAMADAKPTA